MQRTVWFPMFVPLVAPLSGPAQPDDPVVRELFGDGRTKMGLN